MLLEAYKIVSSIWPFVKEVFLWRDGAEAGKPITRQNLIRRKIAVFALMISIAFNYIITGKVVELYKQKTESAKLVTELQHQLLQQQSRSPQCLLPSTADEFAKDLEQHNPDKVKR